MELEDMICTLDTACGMLLVTAMKNREVRNAMELVTKVSLALGEIKEIKYAEYSFPDEDEGPIPDDALLIDEVV